LWPQFFRKFMDNWNIFHVALTWDSAEQKEACQIQLFLAALPHTILKLLMLEHTRAGGSGIAPVTFKEVSALARKVDEAFQQQAEHAQRVGQESSANKRPGGPSTAMGSRPPKYPKQNAWGKDNSPARKPYDGNQHGRGGRSPGGGRGSGGRDQGGRASGSRGQSQDRGKGPVTWKGDKDKKPYAAKDKKNN
jgi:uncharacterized membrane protein YgcG